MAIGGGDGSIILTTKVDTKGISSDISTIQKGIGGLLKTIGKISAVSAAALGTVTTLAVKSYSEYEQLSGGVETLFKESSDTVMQYAERAYETTGMSANEYMSTVTSFSASLLQSLGGDTEAAAQYADQAIIDMSDNANKMGTDIESIQNAYQGFAKQNYTMLDNLKLGYGGTKEEMQRLLDDASKISGIQYDISSFADVTQAIHVMQEEMGIAGTTAKEASTTIQGSASAMKSAWQNMLTGFADPNQDIGKLLENLVSSVSTFGDNILPVISTASQSIVNSFPAIVDSIGSLIEQALPVVIDGVKQLISGLLKSLPQILKSIIKILPTIIDAVSDIIVELANALPSLVETIVDALPDLIQSIVDALPSLTPAIITGIVNAFYVLIQALPQILQPLIDSLPLIITTLIEAIVMNLPVIIQGLIQLILAIITAIPQIIQSLIDELPTIISLIIEGLLSNLPLIISGLIEVTIGVVAALPQIFGSLLEAVPAVLSGIWDGLLNVFGGVGEWFAGIFGGAWDGIMYIWDSVVGYFQGVWDGIVAVFSVAATWFYDTVVKPISDFFSVMWDGIKNGASSVWKGIKSVFSGVAKFFKDIFSKAWEGVKSVFSTMGNVFIAIKDGIVGTFKMVVNGLIKGINAVVALPFEGLNGILNTIQGISIVGYHPFDWLTWRAPVPQLPYLAKGSVIPPNREFLAVLGDNTKEHEIVSPLSTMKQAFTEAMIEMGGNFGGGNSTVILELDGRELGKAVLNEGNRENRRVGTRLVIS